MCLGPNAFTAFVKGNVRNVATFIYPKMANILKLSVPVNAREVDAACESLLTGHIISVPTDTIYGIAGLAQNTDAVNRIYNIKDRDLAKPIAISLADVDDLYKWSKVTVPRDLLCDLLPGPVTVVMERTADLNPHLNAGTQLVGMRIPNYQFIRDLARTCDGPIALTSANVSATRSTLCIQEFENLWPKLDLICDGGELGDTDFSRMGSTVIDLSVRGQYKIIRDGVAKKDCVQLLEGKYHLQARS